VFFKDECKITHSLRIVNKNVENPKKSVENQDDSIVIFVKHTRDTFKTNIMFATLIRKKVSNEKLANVFINGLWNACNTGFPMVAEFINEDPTFVASPEVKKDDDFEFVLIVMIGNISLLDGSFDGEQSMEVESLIYEKLAKIYDMSVFEFKSVVKDYRHLMSRLNAPSKNVIYGMSKTIFDKYTLYNYQDEYFQRMQVPNPLFLKRLDEIVENFVWDWEAFFKRYKMQ